MVATDLHGCGMPPIPAMIYERGAMPRTGDKAAGLEGVRVISCETERSKRPVAYVNTVRIDVEFCSRGGILEIVFSTPFGHPWTFHVGKCPIFARHVLFSHPFMADSFRVSLNQPHWFTFGKQRIAVYFHTVDRGLVRTAPIEVQSAILVQNRWGSQKAKAAGIFSKWS